MSEVSKNIFFSCVLVFFVGSNHFFPSPTPVFPLFSSSSTAPPSSSPPPSIANNKKKTKKKTKKREKKQQEEEEEDKQEEDKHKHKEMFDMSEQEKV